MLATLRLDEEIALYQFAQGVHSEIDLVEQVRQLDNSGKMRQFLDLNSLVRQLKPVDADVQQALTASSLTDRDISTIFVRDNGLRFVMHNMIHLPGDDIGKAYTFLLFLFKIVYQQRFTLGDPTDWRYSDLSNPALVEHMRTRHQETLEAVYTNASFRSEFVSLAKLWHEQVILFRADAQEPDLVAERQTHFTFLSYNEMLTESLKAFTDKHRHGIGLLRHSLEKALSKQYGLSADETQRVVLEVIERHLRETYSTGLF